MSKVFSYAMGAAGAVLSICIYSIIQAPDYNSPNYAEWNRMGYPNEQARQQFEPYRCKWVPRLI